jgi:hypothetical protein
VKIARILLSIISIFIVVLACVSYAGSSDERPSTSRAYLIENNNWNTATVTFLCGSYRMKTERGLSTTEVRRGTVALGECSSPRYVVTFVGSSETIISEPIQGWNPTTLVVIIIQNATNLSYHTLRAA